MHATHTMTTAWTDRNTTGQSLFNRIVARLGLAERMEARRKRLQMIRELESISDYHLAELGIDRRDIHRIAAGEPVAV